MAWTAEDRRKYVPAIQEALRRHARPPGGDDWHNRSAPEVVRQAGHEFREMVEAETLPTAGSA